jgi:hypothetical protein
MKRLMILALVFASCQKTSIDPVEDCNDFCKCGEVTNFPNYINGSFICDVKNNCSGKTEVVAYPTYKTKGDNICLDYCW